MSDEQIVEGYELALLGFINGDPESAGAVIRRIGLLSSPLWTRACKNIGARFGAAIMTFQRVIEEEIAAHEKRATVETIAP